jgi:DNA-binding transcriptional ArsR family regulator
MTMKDVDLSLTARRFAALGDPTRLQVFALLSQESLSVAEVAARLPVSRPAVSQHLRLLADAGLVRCEASGTRHRYRPDADGVASLHGLIDGLWDLGLQRFKREAETLARERAANPAKESP